jgi:DNA-binding transcriptional regulator YiaG
LPFCHAELRAAKPRPERYPKEINTLGDHIRIRRLDLELLQSDVAKQIGVDTATVCNWESNASTPAIRYLPAIIQFLGYDPQPSVDSLPDRLATARRTLGLSQRKMAEKLAVDPGTWQGWEAGRHQPTRTSLELIGRVLREPGMAAVSSELPDRAFAKNSGIAR